MKIPKGWKRLKKGVIIKTGDKVLIGGKFWERTLNAGFLVGVPFDINGKPLTYIRKIKK